MPNFWTAAARKFYEMFTGPRTKDQEFDKKVEQLKFAEKSVQQIKSIYTNFYKNTSGFKVLCRDIYQNLSFIYDESSPFWPMIKEIIYSYTEAEKLYNNLMVKVGEIEKIGEDWDKKHKEVSVFLQKREESRRIYDHYDEKMQKLYKKYEDKAIGSERDPYFIRNEKKFTAAMDNYIRLSSTTFQMMSELIHFRHNYINPTIVMFLREHRRFFELTTELFKATAIFEEELLDINKVSLPVETYDPTKYIHGYELLSSFKKKFTEEEIVVGEANLESDQVQSVPQVVETIHSVNIEQSAQLEREDVLINTELKKPYAPENLKEDNVGEIELKPTTKQITAVEPRESIDQLQHDKIFQPEIQQIEPIPIDKNQSQIKFDLNESDLSSEFKKTSQKEIITLPTNESKQLNQEMLNQNKEIVAPAEQVRNVEKEELMEFSNLEQHLAEYPKEKIIEEKLAVEKLPDEKFSQSFNLGNKVANVVEKQGESNIAVGQESPKSNPNPPLFHHSFDKGERKRSETVSNKRYIL